VNRKLLICACCALLGISIVLHSGCVYRSSSSTRSPSLLDPLQEEIENALAGRDLEDNFARYQRYTDDRLDASAGANTWSDKSGGCRLAWYDWMIRHQLQSPAEAERFTRELHAALESDHHGLVNAFDTATEKLDLIPKLAKPTAWSQEGQLELRDAFAKIQYSVVAAQESFRTALATLQEEEQQELRRDLYAVTTQRAEDNALSFVDAAAGRRMCELLRVMDRQALVEAGRTLLPIANTALLDALSRHSATNAQRVSGIMFAGPGADNHDMDAMMDISVLIDCGGDDTYTEGTVSADRPVLVIIDLGGNDVYRGRNPGIQGGAVLGVSMLIDCAGNDQYEAVDVAQGACLGGVGILIDFSGDDTYRGLRRNQGSAMGGIAFHVDRSGNDSYHSALFAQGFGGPLGFGMLDDLSGQDHYYAGGKWADPYGDTPGYAGVSQGVGSGPRGVANGGIGVLLDGGGDDTYECDYFSHGGGYWFAAGFARDFGGNDERLGATRLAYDGGEREEAVFLRWGIAWQAHYGLGFVFDDEGDDRYGGNVVGLGFSWDVGTAGLIDLAGNDHYLLDKGGQGHEAGFGFLYDVGGNDTYGGTEYGTAGPSVTYHPEDQSGGNFAFSINIGGHDEYGDEEWNNTVRQQGSPGGFLIDREAVTETSGWK